jgi:hypothetical protein
MIKQEMVSFWTTGKYMTKILRDLWKERNCIHAFRTAKEGLNMDSNIALQIFEGKSKLIGDTRNDPDLYLRKDNYKGITIDQMTLYFEQLYIFEKIDMLKLNFNLWSRMEKSLHFGRGNSIMDTKILARDLTYYHEKKMINILAQIMFLYNIQNKYIGDFFDKVLKKIKNVWQEKKEEDYVNHLDPVSKSLNKIKMDQMIAKISPLKSIDDYIENQKKILATIVTEGSVEDAENCYVSPNGKIYPCCYLGHVDLRSKLIKKGIVELGNEIEMEEAGWLKISMNKVLAGFDKTPTKKQMDFIFNFMEYNKTDKISFNGVNFTFKGLLKFIDRSEGKL